MSNLLTSIIYAIMGAAIIVASIMTKAGTEVLILGIVLTAFALGCLIYSLISKKKKEK